MSKNWKCSKCGYNNPSHLCPGKGSPTIGQLNSPDPAIRRAAALAQGDSNTIGNSQNPPIPNQEQQWDELDRMIDKALHPERNGLLIKEHIAEGANYEWLVKRELKTALTHFIKGETDRAIEAFITDGWGERCKTKDADDFKDTNGGRCPTCEIWEHYDEYQLTTHTKTNSETGEVLEASITSEVPTNLGVPPQEAKKSSGVKTADQPYKTNSEGGAK